MLLILVAMVLQDDVHVAIIGVLAIDQGEEDAELVFSSNSYGYATNSVNINDDWIYISPLPVQDNDTLKTQWVL